MSWQSTLLCTFLRLTMKRAARRGIDPLQVRARLDARPGALRIPRGWTVTPLAADDLAFEVARRDTPMRPDRAVLYLHGGGYFFGSPRTHRPLILAMAREADAPCYALDYRLAPEHPYPAALEDAIAAYRALLTREPNRRIILAGDSAGGGLAIALAAALRDRNLPPPVAMVLFSPWTDLALTGASIQSNAKRCAMFTPAALREATRFYLAAADPTEPGASPHYADPTGLPPSLVFAGTDETLRDDSTRFAENARAHGVPVELRLVPGVPHVWPLFARLLPEGRTSLAEIAPFLAGLS